MRAVIRHARDARDRADSFLSRYFEEGGEQADNKSGGCRGSQDNKVRVKAVLSPGDKL